MIESSRQDMGLADDMDRLAQLLAEEGCGLVSGLECRITVIPSDHPDTVRMLAVAGAGTVNLKGTEWPLEQAPTRWALEARAPVERTVRVGDSEGLVAMMPGPVTRVRAVPLARPQLLTDARASLGAFIVLRQGDQPFTKAEAEIIDAYASLTSVALVRAELRLETIRQSRRLEIGVEMAVDLAASPTPDDVVRHLLERAADVVAADRAGLARVEGETVITEGAHDVDGLPVFPGSVAPLRSQPLTRQALETGRPVLGGGPDLRTVSPEMRDAFRDVRHTALLPLLSGGNVVGFLSVSRRRDPGFTDGDIKTLQTIGNVAVLALRNARLYADAQSAAEGMSSFVDLVVHELRSPLTVIAGYVDMMVQRSGDQRGAWEKPLAVVAAKIGEMQALINELVLSARLAHGAMPPSTEAVDLRDRIDNALRRAEPRRVMVEAEFVVHLPPDPIMVTCDPTNIDHILDNLINNALSYGGLGPRICVQADPAPRGPRVVVEDHGPGISPELHERVFERFFRVNPLPGQAGSGLGLHISRQLAAQSRGSLEIEYSEPGRGSRFVLKLPAAASSTGGRGPSR